MATYQYQPYPTGNPPASSANTTGGTKYRIYNVFKPSIVLDELSLNQADTENTTQRVEDYASLQYPLIKINNYILSVSEIDYFRIDSRDFVPSITLSVTFSNQLFLAKELPKDGDIISVAIRSKSDSLNMVRNDYVITGVSVKGMSTVNKGAISMTFFGTLFIPGLKSYMGSASYKGTSMELLKWASRQLGLGFNTNETETDDLQIWYLIDSPETFINDVVSRAWKDEKAFFDVWIDVYYNLNFINVQKQLLSAEDDVDAAAWLSNVDKDRVWGSQSKQSETVVTAKVFSNFSGVRNSSFYITNWKPDNRSSSITFQYGTSMYASFFEHLNSLYRDENSQKYWNIKIEPDYDEQKLDSYILLRGRAKYDPDVNEGELARANYDYTELYRRSPWMGIQYTINNPQDDNSQWTGNMHKNYLRARVHNCINNVELEKLMVNVDVQGTNFNVIRGDKIPTVIVRKDAIENQVITGVNIDAAVDFFYSGWYYVKGFTLSYTRGGGILSNFSQSFMLTRREWPTPEPIEPIKKPENQN